MSDDNNESGTFRAANLLRRVSATDVSTLLQDAYARFEAGNFPDAQKICSQALEQDPQNFNAHQIMAMACYHAGERGRAITHFETCVSLQPENFQTQYYLGTVLTEENRLAEAEACFRKTVELEPNSAEAYTNLGSALQMQDRTEEAIPFYEQSLALNPESAGAISNLAIALQQLGRFQDAVIHYKKAIEYQPDAAFLHFNLGISLEELESWNDAVASYEQAIKIQPDYIEALVNLAILYHESGAFEKAIPLYRRAVSIDPTNPDLNHKLALVLREHGQIDEAIRISEEAIKNNQASPRTIIELSLALFEKGDTEAAIESFLQPTRVMRTVGRKHSQTLDTFDVINRPKINHDIDQLTYLMERNIIPADYHELVEEYRDLAKRIPDPKKSRLGDLSPLVSERFATSYNRLIHMAEAPHLPGGAVNPNLDRAAIEKDFSSHDPGFTTFDDLLTPQAIEALRKFCLESTFWFDVHYTGDVGAGIENGFCSPLIFQIAREIREALPGILGEYPFSSCWTFKYMEAISGLSTHADDGSVSINFWITPDEANLNPETSGIEFWNKKAPYNYFSKPYEEKSKTADMFLKEPDAQSVYVPYRCNRAMMFHSNVFHNTAPIDFKEGHKNRRINMTFMYGRPRLEAKL